MLRQAFLRNGTGKPGLGQGFTVQGSGLSDIPARHQLRFRRWQAGLGQGELKLRSGLRI